MQKSLTVIKIGGSIIFDQSGNINKNLVSELFKIFSLLNTPKIVVLGCGKKLHGLTYKYNLTDKPETKEGKIMGLGERLSGFFEIYKIIEKNLFKVASLAPEFERPLTIHPANLFIKKSEGSKGRHEIVWLDERVFDHTHYLLTSGGIVLDQKILVSAVSSDTIASYLAKTYGANKMILLSDVDGVYSNINGGELLREVSLKKIRNYKVIGGMSSKLRRIKLAVNEGIPTVIINGNFPERVRDVLSKGKTKICSEILP